MEPIIVAKVIGTVAYMLVEYWLGKTNKVKAGSVLEGILMLTRIVKK